MISGSKYMPCNNIKKGFSLIEAVVYVALLGVVSVFVANSLIYLTGTYARSRAEREVLSNARSLMERVSSHIAASQEVYGFTSRCDADAGQLSLLTATTSTPGHTAGFTDFWVDAGVVSMREEGAVALPLSSASVQITVFKCERIIQSLGREAVRVTIRADAAAARFPASATLTTTTALRGNY